jgi:hypothetical protein
MSTLNVDTLQDKAGAFEHARLVQVVSTETGAVATGTTVLPLDDTIPQNDEGNEVMTLAITPTNASNKLLIEVVTNQAHATGGTEQSAALFQDTTASALAVGFTQAGHANYKQQVIFTHFMVAGATSSTTFKVRIGANDSGTITFNGSGGSRIFGGALASSITISEIRV